MQPEPDTLGRRSLRTWLALWLVWLVGLAVWAVYLALIAWIIFRLFGTGGYSPDPGASQ